MKKYECTVTREDIYIIEFDETKYTEEEMAEFRKNFYNLDNYKEHAEFISQHKARFEQSFIEGYGHISVNGELPYGVSNDAGDCVCEGINIKVISEDEECEVYVIEIKE